ncbi:MAG: hypothetical protein JKX85_13750, partial [Phycisphaeraceae bacterium]|nr:hypothetical protein [Phycisphaeraceae bacterium]
CKASFLLAVVERLHHLLVRWGPWAVAVAVAGRADFSITIHLPELRFICLNYDSAPSKPVPNVVFCADECSRIS